MVRSLALILFVISSVTLGACQTPVMGYESVGSDLLVNVSASRSDPSPSVAVPLPEGTYRVVPVGTAGGGAYDAWKAWCWSEHQNGDGTWSIGWLNAYCVGSGEFGVIRVSDGVVYSSARGARERAQTTTFRLKVPGTVSFFIEDDPRFDNSGGMSLLIQKSSDVP